MPISTDPDFRPGRDYLSNKEIKATGLLIGGAVGNICRELLERREADRWIPVSDRLPEDRKPVLVFTVGLSKPDGIRTASFNKDQPLSMFWHGQIAGHGKGVTHWRPLPTPPKQGEPQ